MPLPSGCRSLIFNNMGNSLLFGEAVWPYGFVVLIVLGGSLIALAIYFLRAGKVMTSKDQDDEQNER